MTAPKAQLALAFACLALAGPGPVHAGSGRPVEIEDVRIGFPAREGHRCRPGAWCPVHVELRTGQDGIPAGEYELAVETADSDDVPGQYVVSVPALGPGKQHTVLTYYRPGNRTASLKAIVRKKGGAVIHFLEKAPGFNETLRPEDILYLAVGGQPPGLRNALVPARKAGQETPEQDEQRAERGIAVIDKPGDLPDRWFGYAGVDVVVLSTSGGLVRQLLAPAWSAEVEALDEWVRRGGRLVVGAGRNARDAVKLLERLGLVGIKLKTIEAGRGLQEVQEWAGVSNDPFPGEQSIEVARFELGGVGAGRNARDEAIPLVRDRVKDRSWPVVALAPCGLGRVLLVAFDLDAPAFAAWKGQGRFWEAVHAELAPRQATRGRGQDAGERPDELGTFLQRGLENFDAVPAVSFGWVAFFMLVYILLIGPLDYLFLKKVVKRLELTWVTFPLVVLVVSVAAYFTAHALKGGDLRVNKLDVVDIDLRSGEVQGTTWFALFSPRVESYTIGIEPAPGWLPSGSSSEGTVVTTLSPPDSSAGGIDRPGSSPVFRRPYVYAADASGLKGVPVPVWASRSFTASWRARVEGSAPVEGEGFGLSRDRLRLIGRIQSRLPVELRDVSLFYNGNWYALADLPAGGSYRVDAQDISRGAQGSPVPWMNDPYGRAARAAGTEGRPRLAEVPAPASLMKTMLFHGLEAGPQSHLANSGLRLLDQGWRLRGLKGIDRSAAKHYLDEAIVVGRAVVPAGRAEDVVRDGASPTRLWLGDLPGGDRPTLPGVMSQETYVRIYIPVGGDRE